jgi:hypothetical protein
MARFRNSTQSFLILTDENGNTYKWEAGETREASNYFYNYTSAGGASDPILILIGNLDGDGTIPSPALLNDNRLRQPGQTQDYLGEAQANAQREKEIVFDISNENSNARRRIDSRFVGLKALPFPEKSNTGNTATGLNAATTITLTAGDGPIQINGRRANAADAAANPAVVEGGMYTVFGVITVTDISPSATYTVYFSIRGTSDVVFVEATSGNPITVPASAVVTVGTPSITFGPFTGGAAGDSISVNTKFAQSPNTAAKLAAAFDLGHNADGYYVNTQQNIIFIIEGNDVHQITPTASATIS